MESKAHPLFALIFTMILCILQNSDIRAQAAQSNFQPIIQAFLPDLFTGSNNAAVDIATPPMRPSVSFGLRIYYQYGALETLGKHWKLNIPLINRRKLSTPEPVYQLQSGSVQGQLQEVDPKQNIFQLTTDKTGLKITKINNYFESKSADGTVVLYGKDQKSRLQSPDDPDFVVDWYINSIVDVHGNIMTFEYDNIGGTPLIKTIKFGNRTGERAPHSIEFSYKPTKPITFYDWVFPTTYGNLLDSITVKSFERDFRTYQLTYADDELMEPVLYSVTELGDRGKESHVHTFTFTQQPLFQSQSPISGPARPAGEKLQTWCYVADFNGDGRTDTACPTNTRGPPYSSPYEMSLSTNSGYVSTNWTGPTTDFPVVSPFKPCLTLDANGDGKADLFCFAAHSRAREKISKYQLGLSTGDGWLFFPIADGPGIANGEIGQKGFRTNTSISERCIALDINGDLQAEVLCSNDGKAYSLGSFETLEGKLTAFHVTDAGNGPKLAFSVFVPGNSIERSLRNQCLVADLNGDRRSDLICQGTADTTYQLSTSNGQGIETKPDITGPERNGFMAYSCRTGRSNQDSNDDLICQNKKDELQIAISTGKDLVVQGWAEVPKGKLGKQCEIGDFNGDTRADLLCWVDAKGAYQLAYSSNGAVKPIPITGPSLPSWGCIVGSFDQDSAADVLCESPKGTSEYIAWNTTGARLGRLSNVMTPAGLTITYEYNWKEPGGENRIPFKVAVVDSVSFLASPSSTPIIHKFNYDGAFYDPIHDEFRGFAISSMSWPEAEDGGTRVEKYYFHQGDAADPTNEDRDVSPLGTMKGELYRVQRIGTKDIVYENTTTTYKQIKGGSTRIAPSKVTVESCDEYGCYRTAVKTAVYDSDWNLISQLSDVSGKLSEPSVSISRTYIKSSTAKGLVSREETKDLKTGRLLRESAFTYDSNVSCGDRVYTHKEGRNLITVIDALNGEHHSRTKIAYDAYGNTICRETPSGSFSIMTYDPSGNLLLSVTNALGSMTSYNYYGLLGKDVAGGPPGYLAGLKDANGNGVDTEYDGFGRKIRETLPKDHGWTSWNYSVMAGLNVVNTKDKLGRDVVETWDGLSRLVSQETKISEGNWLDLKQQYNNRGALMSVDGPALRGVVVNTAKFSYDGVGRRILATDQDGRAQSYCYGDGRKLSRFADGQTLNEEMNSRGQLTYTFFSDQVSGVHSCEELLAQRPRIDAKFSYDALGQLLSVERSGKVTTVFAYDMYGRKTDVSDLNNGVTHYTYDDDGGLVEVITRGGVRKRMTRDRIGRLTTILFGEERPQKLPDVQLVYDEASVENGRGRLTKIVSRNYSKTLSYDSIGNVTATTIVAFGKEYSIKKLSDFRGRLLHFEAAGSARDFEYTADRLARILVDGKPAYEAKGVNLVGAPLQVEMPGLGSVATTYKVPGDPFCEGSVARVCKFSVFEKAGTPIFEEAYGYDAQGKLQDVTRVNQQVNYERDFAGRITDVRVSDLATPPGSSVPPKVSQEHVSYDAWGRIESTTRSGKYSYSKVSDAVPHDGPVYIGNDYLQFRADGRVTRIGAQQYVYDARGTLTFSYGPSGWTSIDVGPDGEVLRTQGSNGSVLYLGDGVYCQDSVCQIIGSTYNGVSLVSSSAKLYAVVADPKGSPRVWLAPDTLEVQNYSLFGNPDPVGKLVTTGTRKGLAGQQYLPEMGKYALRERIFDPNTATFLSPDNLESVDVRTAFGGRYVYGYGDPLEFRDPNGQFAWMPVLVGAIIGGATAAIHGDDWDGILRGATMGAIGGAFCSALCGEGFEGVIAAGALSGGANAAIFGGDVEDSILQGAVLGAFTHFANSSDLSVFGDENGLGGSLDYTFKTALRGMASSGVHALATGEDIGDALARGAMNGAAGAVFNMAVGHAWGFANSGEAPYWVNGAWFYYSPGTWGITLGNVITGDDSLFLPASTHSISNRPFTQHPLVFEHELAHIPQSMDLGFGYIPLAALSYAVGGAWEVVSSSSGTVSERFLLGTHKNSPMENDWGYTTVPDF